MSRRPKWHIFLDATYEAMQVVSIFLDEQIYAKKFVQPRTNGSDGNLKICTWSAAVINNKIGPIMFPWGISDIPTSPTSKARDDT